MPAAKLCSSRTLNGILSEESNGSIDTFIRQAVGTEPLIPSTRTVDSSVQWIQWLNSLDQPDLPGWPMVTPMKVPMQKCEKCSHEFCSPINYRRHVRVHRRSLNVNKDCHNNRDLLAAFWDKISLGQAKDVLSLNDVMLKEIPGSSVVSALASSVHKPGIWTLPSVYVTAGNALLDILQDKPSGLPISSQELFSILDDASERTFLCAGTAGYVQKYVFDGETVKNCLQLKNLVACASFFFELQLVKAWIADKDAEALRCQKFLVEEEEAAQKRQAALLEKKRQKKLRQKKQKLKEQFNGCSVNMDANVDSPNSDESSGPSSPSDSILNLPDLPTNPDSHSQSTQSEIKESNEEDPKVQVAGLHPDTNHWQAPKSQRRNRFLSNLQPSKFEPVHKLNPSKDRCFQNVTKIWTKKLKSDPDGKNLNPPSSQGDTGRDIEDNNFEVIIGSISITLKKNARQGKSSDISSNEHDVIPKKNVSEKLTKANQVQSGDNNRVSSKNWRRVRHCETKSVPQLDRDNEGCVILSSKVPDQFLSTDVQTPSVDVDFDNRKQNRELFLNDDCRRGYLPFSRAAAKEFLAQRWKEAISAEHVTLVLSEPKPRESSDIQCESSTSIPIISDPGIRLTEIFRSSSKKPVKGVKIKAILKAVA